MPAGSKRPFTKEQKLKSEANKAEGDFKNNRAKFDKARERAIKGDPFAVAEGYIRAFKDNGKREKMETTKKNMEASPKGVKNSMATSTKGFHNDENWKSLDHKNGVFTTRSRGQTQVTPGEWKTKGK